MPSPSCPVQLFASANVLALWANKVVVNCLLYWLNKQHSWMPLEWLQNRTDRTIRGMQIEPDVAIIQRNLLWKIKNTANRLRFTTCCIRLLKEAHDKSCTNLEQNIIIIRLCSNVKIISLMSNCLKTYVSKPYLVSINLSEYYFNDFFRHQFYLQVIRRLLEILFTEIGGSELDKWTVIIGISKLEPSTAHNSYLFVI